VTTSPLAAPADLASFLGSDVDEARATLLLRLAQDRCEEILSPLPEAALGIVLSAAARGYANPQGVSSEGIGPFNVQRPWAGVYLTKSERVSLKRLSSNGGAFTVDPTPKDASPSNYWPQIPMSPLDTWTNPPYYGDWDWPAV